MRRKLSSNAEVAHYYANRIQDEGEGSNFFFKDGKLYSYGHHFCIARRLSYGVVLFTTRGYSPSTGRHISLARNALSHARLVFCHDPDAPAHSNMAHARDNIETLLIDSTKKGIRQTTKDKILANVLYVAEQANTYLAALPEDERGTVQPIDTSNFDAWRDQLAVAQREKEAKEAAALELKKAAERERLALWRTGEADTNGMWNLPPALRIKDDQVQTSKGASIPVSHAFQFWPLVQSVRTGQRTSDEAKAVMSRLGVFTLTRIERDGSIVVGCHNIAYAELKLIADQLGLKEAA